MRTNKEVLSEIALTEDMHDNPSYWAENYLAMEAKLAAAEADAEAVQKQREDLKDKYALVEISDIPLLLESAAQRIAIGDWVFAGKLMKAAELLQAELTTPEDV